MTNPATQAPTSRHYEGSGLKLSWRPLRTGTGGPVMEIAVEGKLSFRMMPHEQADILYDFVKACIAENQPAGLVLDMRRFRYRHGDSIGALFAQPDPHGSGLMPISVVARGRTRRGLASLLAFLGEPYDLPCFVTRRPEEALSWLDEALSGGSGPSPS